MKFFDHLIGQIQAGSVSGIRCQIVSVRNTGYKLGMWIRILKRLLMICTYLNDQLLEIHFKIDKL